MTVLDLCQLGRICEPYGLRAEELKWMGTSQNEVFEHAPLDEQSIIRVSNGRGRTLEHVEAELDWIEDLARRGVDACRPILSRAGRRCERVVHSQTEHLVVRFHRAPGRKIEHADINASLYAGLGRLTAHLHAASFDSEPPAMVKHPRPHWYDSRLLTSDLAQYTPAHAEAFRAAVGQLVEELKPSTADCLGLVHADVSFSNTFLDGKRLWIFDFDNCEVGSIVQDFATILYDSIYCRVLNRVPEVELNARIRQRWSEFLEGYCAARALEPIEQDTLRKFLILREAIIYTHYCRVLNPATFTDSWRAGMELMRENVERGITQIDLLDQSPVTGAQLNFKDRAG